MNKIFNPLVSIIIPVYNGEKYMREAIDSALAQTYGNIEILVINDGSKDTTDKIAKSYTSKIRYFSKENGGVSTALNLGIENMKGEYFSWLSHDDVYLPQKIESEINLLSTLENKKTVIYSGFQCINSESKITNTINLDKNYSQEQLNISLFPFFHELISGCTLLIHKDLLIENGLFDITQKTTQDYDMWFKILQKYPIKYDTNCYTQSRSHQQQVSNTCTEHAENCNHFWINTIRKTLEKQLYLQYASKIQFLIDIDYTFFKMGYYTKTSNFIHTLLVNEKDSTNISPCELQTINILDFMYIEKIQQQEKIKKSSIYDNYVSQYGESKLMILMIRLFRKIQFILSKYKR